jgi:site-specific recombinase XerD
MGMNNSLFVTMLQNWSFFMTQIPRKPSTNKKSTPIRQQPGKTIPRRNERTLLKAFDEYLADHRSQNHSPKTIAWHTLSLGNLISFLEQKGIIYIKDLEKEHLVEWINALTQEPGLKGKLRKARTINTYARSMRAFCRWLEIEGYVEIAPSNRVKMPKIGKPLIRIIEFDEFERILKACTPPQEVGPTADRNAARNRAIFWVLWDTGIRLAELCDLRFSNFDRDKGVIIVHGKGDKERRGDIFTLQELLGHEDMATIKQYMHLNDMLIQEQKRKFSPGDNVPFNGATGGKKARTDFRDSIKRKPGGARGQKTMK